MPCMFYTVKNPAIPVSKLSNNTNNIPNFYTLTDDQIFLIKHPGVWMNWPKVPPSSWEALARVPTAKKLATYLTPEGEGPLQVSDVYPCINTLPHLIRGPWVQSFPQYVSSRITLFGISHKTAK